MTEKEREQLQNLHDFFFKSHLEGKPTRAEQLDEVLMAVRAGKFGSRIILWLAGFVAALGVIWAYFTGVPK